MNRKLPGLSLFLAVVPLAVASWALVHLLAIFGVFLAVAYPLWWIFAPQKSFCLLCRAKKDGDWCPFCRRRIEKERGIRPPNMSSAILNGALILVFSLISFALVFGESQLLFRFGFPITPRTVSFVIPAENQYRLGEMFPMKIEIAAVKTPINAVQADLGFEPSKLEAVDISIDGSFANIFIQKEINNEMGYVRLTGGLANPGFSGEHGVFGTVFFRSKSPGAAKVEYLPTSMVLANDGRGTNVLKDLASVSFLILPEKISEEEEKRQKNIDLKTDVLVDNSGNVQMKFYDEEKVLGAEAAEEIQAEKEFSLPRIFLEGLEKVDRFILERWQRVFNILK